MLLLFRFVLGFGLLSLPSMPRIISAPYPVIDVTLDNGALRGPTTAHSGWTTIRVRGTDSLRHWAVAFQLDASTDPAAFVAAFDTARGTPKGAVALGGPDGASTEAIINLPAGRILFACPHRHTTGRRHATVGEWQVVTVERAPRNLPAPTAGISVEAMDFAFSAPSDWPRGPSLIELSNKGKHDHLLLIAKLKPGIDLAAYTAAKDVKTVSEPAVGVARLGPGQRAFVPVTLTRGHYIIFCRIVDETTQRRHDELGMMREIVVSPGS